MPSASVGSRPHEQVVMRRHQAPRVAFPAVAVADAGEDRQEATPVGRVAERDAADVRVRGDMEDPVFDLDARWPSHAIDRSVRARRRQGARLNRHASVTDL
jgi:hypothetical protein